jgi:hypothetical protein
MLRRSLVGLVVVLMVVGIVLAEETQGTITKIDDTSVTIRTGGFRKDKEKSEEKTFKLSSGVKITRTSGRDKDKEPVKLTLDELKVAVKVTNVSVTVTHEGENGTELKVGGRGRGRTKNDK